MPKFQFVARASDGRVQRGLEAADSAAAAVTALRGRGWTVIDVQAAGDEGVLFGDVLAKASPARWLPIRSIDVEISLSQLAVMLRGGLTLLSGIGNVIEQCPRARLAKVWEDMARQVQMGSSFAEAMSKHRCFPPLVVQMVRIGEQTGNLEPVLRRSAEVMERRRGLRNTLLTVLSYPSLVLIAAIAVTAYMIFNVIPKLEQFLQQLGRRLPPMTQSLLDISAYARQHAVHGALIAVALITIAAITYTNPGGRLLMDRFVLKTPGFGYLLRLAGTALVARALGMLLRSGVTLLEGLRTAELLPRNRYLQRRLTAAREHVLSGGSLAEGLRDPGAFLSMLPAMAAVGESTGTLDDVLDETARFHEEQLQVAIRRFSAFVEPAIIVVVGGIVGYVYIAFFVAMFAAAGSAS